MHTYITLHYMYTHAMYHKTFQVTIGQYISEPLDKPLRYITNTPSEILVIIIPVIVGVVVVVVFCSMFIICCVVCYHIRKSKKNEQRWTNLLSQMELMELEMADECKRGESVDFSLSLSLSLSLSPLSPPPHPNVGVKH